MSVRAILFAMILGGSSSPVLADEVPMEHLLELGVSTYNAGDYAAARRHFRVLAAREVAAAETMLGIMAAKGQGGPREPAIAAAWYLRAARRGHPAAQLALAHAFATGQGVRRDYERALALASAAHAAEQPGAAELGVHIEGRGADGAP